MGKSVGKTGVKTRRIVFLGDPMNAYLFSSIQSTAYGNLFECSTHEENGCDVVFSSMSHENEVGVMDEGDLITAEVLAEKLVSNYE